MEVGDKFTHQGVEYTVINILEPGKVEGRASVPVGTPGASPSRPKVIQINEVDITP